MVCSSEGVARLVNGVLFGGRRSSCLCGVRGLLAYVEWVACLLMWSGWLACLCGVLGLVAYVEWVACLLMCREWLGCLCGVRGLVAYVEFINRLSSR